MAQNQNNQNCKEVCKKKGQKVSFKPLRTTFFPMSHKTTKTPVDIEISEQDNVQNSPKASKPSSHVAAAKNKSSKDVQHEVKMDQTKSDDKFSDYIKKFTDKMRNASNIGVARAPTRRDSFNDKISNYINRAKIKIRTTSVGDDKSV